jgi:glycosyltransferase involved in cell wall biosynthesis
MKKVLIITYYWPPSGGAGVQRWLKFVKYLPQFGWEPVIYTPENPEAPVNDDSLLADIPEGTEVLKTKVWEPYAVYKKFVGLKKSDKISTGFLSEKKKPSLAEKMAVWIRGNLFIPDARKFWIKPSIKYLEKYLKENPVDVIISSGPPHSMHLIALALKNKLNIPWLADFRDPWTKIDFYHELKLTPSSDQKHQRLEKEVLQQADKVIVVSNGMKRSFNQLFTRDYEVITNGYDEEDMHLQLEKNQEKFIIAHIGSLNKSRNPVALWKALQQLIAENRQLKNSIQVKLVGQVDYSVKKSIEDYGLMNYVKMIQYIPHQEVVKAQQESSVLLLVINNTPNSQMILTGKFFEYLAARRSILCIGPEDGDAAEIIRETASGFVSGFNDEAGLKKHILELFADFQNCLIFTGGSGIEKYSRKSLTGQLSQVLNEMILKSS